MTYIVSGGALNSTHSLIPSVACLHLNSKNSERPTQLNWF